MRLLLLLLLSVLLLSCHKEQPKDPVYVQDPESYARYYRGEPLEPVTYLEPFVLEKK